MMKCIIVLLILFFYCDGARILGIFNHPGASHTFLGKVLLKELVKRGHEVVMISSFPMEDNVQNYTDIILEENLEDLKKRSMMYFVKNKGNEIEDLRNMSRQHTENTFTNPDVQKLLKSNKSFDIIIMDWFLNQATLIFGHIYKAPVIYISSFGNNALLSDFSGNTLPFSYVPGAGMIMSDDMSFLHRIVMSAVNILFNFLFSPQSNQAHHEILRKYFVNPPSIEELQKNVALILSNSHFSFETPRPYTPNIIPVGGFHIEESKVLSEDLQQFLDGSEQGVIYFSLGSQIKSSTLNKTLLNTIVQALGKASQQVLWKCDEDVPDLPANIKIVKWAPQKEILEHRNTKLFITHGGVLSMIEAIHFHVPMLCIPFNGDQNTNAAFVNSRKIGKIIIQEEATVDAFYSSVLEILTNKQYQQNINFYSSLLREQPIKPIENAIYWVEHVIKHRHGNHLKTFATKLPWYKYYMVDVIALFGALVIILLKIIYLIIKNLILFSYRLIRVKKQKVE